MLFDTLERRAGSAARGKRARNNIPLGASFFGSHLLWRTFEGPSGRSVAATPYNKAPKATQQPHHKRVFKFLVPAGAVSLSQARSGPAEAGGWTVVPSVFSKQHLAAGPGGGTALGRAGQVACPVLPSMQGRPLGRTVLPPRQQMLRRPNVHMKQACKSTLTIELEVYFFTQRE